MVLTNAIVTSLESNLCNWKNKELQSGRVSALYITARGESYAQDRTTKHTVGGSARRPHTAIHITTSPAEKLVVSTSR